MKLPLFCGLQAVTAVAAVVAAQVASAHSASDAYLSLDAPVRSSPGAVAETVVHGQWDIALRDLDFVLKLDDNGDGNITWGELRKHQDAIARYAYGFLKFSADGKACDVRPTRQMIDNHADGAYAAMFFSVVCKGAPPRLTLDYQMFFAIDPSHRGILVFRSGTNTATSLLSLDNARIDLKL